MAEAMLLATGYIAGLVHWQLVEWWRERRIRRAERRR